MNVSLFLMKLLELKTYHCSNAEINKLTNKSHHHVPSLLTKLWLAGWEGGECTEKFRENHQDVRQCCGDQCGE